MIPDENNVDQQIVQKEPSEGSEGLGVFLSPDGNDKDQFNALTKKIKNWSDKIAKGYLSCFAANVALCTTLSCTIEYPLAATTFSIR